MAINGVESLDLIKVQKQNPKGSAVAANLAAAYKSLGQELKSDYPCKDQAQNMSYGSKGKTFEV